MINVIISGCNGKMGQVISNLINKEPDLCVVAGIDKNNIQQNNTYPVYFRLEDCKEKGSVVIDFSNPESLEGLLEYCINNKTPLILATTGFSQAQFNRIINAAKIIPIFQSANMSLGINLVVDLIEKAARVLQDTFDIEIIEKHHNQKVDAPSGTALMFAESINSVLSQKCEYAYERASNRKKRTKNEIGIHSLRGGTIVGEHSVIFAGNDEIVEVNHIAVSRNVFGMGALKAIKFITGKQPGFYNMKTLISNEVNGIDG